MAFPLSPVNGQTTTVNGIKYSFDSASNSWTRVSSPGASFTVTTDTFVGTGSQTAFSLSVTPANVDTLLVNIDGVQQQRTAYTLANNTITFTGTPVLGAVIEVKTWAAYNMSVITGLVYDSFTGDGTTVAFTLNAVPTSKNFTIVTVGGITQAKNTYNIASNVITFSAAPPNTAPIEVTTLGPAVNGSMAGGTNTTVQFNNNGVLDGLTNLTISNNTLNAPNVSVIGNVTTSNLTASSTIASANISVTGTTTSANVSVGNLTTTGNVNLGSIANVHINGGTSGQLLVTDGAGNLSFNTVNIPGSFTATANGAISTGNSVIVNADSTVTKVTAVPESLSGETLISLTGYTTNYQDFDSVTGKLLSVFMLTNNVYAVVGTFSNGTMTYGAVSSSLISGYNIGNMTKVLSIGDNKFVAGFSDSTNSVTKFYVFTVSGTSVLVGSATTLSVASISADRAALAYNPTTNLLMVTYNPSNVWYVSAATITGTTIGTFGTQTTVYSHNNYVDLLFAYFTGGKLFMFGRYTNSAYIMAYYATFSGTTPTVTSSTQSPGTGEVLTYGNVNIAFNPTANKFVVLAYNTYITVGTINATAGTITWGTPVNYNSILVANQYKQIMYDPSIDQFVVQHESYTSSYDTSFAYVTLSSVLPNTIISVVASTVPKVISMSVGQMTYLGLGKAFLHSKLSSVDSTTFRGRIWQSPSTNLLTENFVGMAASSVANGQTATVYTFGSIISTASGLTPGKKYYLTADGSLSTSTTMTPYVFAGTAITPTKLIIKG